MILDFVSERTIKDHHHHWHRRVRRIEHHDRYL
jgi:hypothetical protein